MSAWIRVSRRAPCRVCRHTDWCTYTADGAACCMRVESGARMRNGGWLHQADAPLPPLPPPPKRAEPPRIDAAALWRAWRTNTLPERVDACAAALGVSCGALDALGAAWAPQHGAWAFPMHVAGQVVGIRLRASDGRKWAVAGSRQGLFVPAIEWQEPRILVCEGPTDTAAALTLGFDAIGRPSCRGLETETVRLLRALKAREVVLVADNDAPGQAGAAQLAAELPFPHRVWVPPSKDLRALVRDGATPEDVSALIGHSRLQTGR